MKRTAIVAALAAALLLPATAPAEVPPGADWTEHYISGALGEPTLHADVMRPKGLKETDKTPVILAIGPYFAHSAQTTPPDPTASGPQLRFNDLIQEGRIFERGYTLVQVDLRGFGASQGCNDFGGPGEQADARRAVEWAASQPWSTGKVGMWGKSYDAWTQVMALDENPKGLAAAVIQAPIIDGYRTLYQNGVHYDAGWYATPALYQAIDANPPTLNDSPEYYLGWAAGTNPACYAANIAQQNALMDPDDAAGFWKARELPGARGSSVPVLWSHGFLDANTKPDNFMDVWSKLKGPARAWFGQFDHVRGNEVEPVGRAGFMAEAMRWLDRYVKGDESSPVEKDPVAVIQDSAGRWRAEAQWPPADATMRVMAVKPGTYTDDDSNQAWGNEGATGNGLWSISPPLPHAARIAGVPRIALDLSTPAPRANLIALLYDLAPDGKAVLITRGAHAVHNDDAGVQFELYPEDWNLQEGHRLALLVSGSDEDWYTPPHSQLPVEVTGGSLQVPFLGIQRTQFLDGGPATAMKAAQAPIDVTAEEVSANGVAFDAPPAMRPAGRGSGASGGGPAARPKPARLRMSVRARKGRRLLVTVTGAASYPVRFVVRRGSRTVATRTVRPRRGRASVTFRLRRAGRYRVTATPRGTGAPLAARRTARVR